MADPNARITPDDGGEAEGAAAGHAPKEDGQQDKKQIDSQKSDNVGDDDVIPVRRSALSNAQHIIARQSKKIEQMRNQGAPNDKDDDDGVPDDDIDAKIERAIAARVDPLQQHLLSRADEDELQELYTQESDAKALDKKIRAYINFKDASGNRPYANVPPSVIYHHLAFAQAQSQGAGRRRAADRAAAHSGGAGHSRRPADNTNEENIPDVTDMSDDDFDALKSKVKTGRFQ